MDKQDICRPNQQYDFEHIVQIKAQAKAPVFRSCADSMLPTFLGLVV